jgi:hypothetical protein
VTDSIEAQVVIAARDSLRQISPAAGYHTRPRVEMGFRPPSPLTEPTLMVYDASGSTVERIIHYPPIWEHRVRFRIHALAVESGEDGRVRALLNLRHDVRRRLLRDDRTLGGLLTTQLAESEPDDTDEATGGTAGEALMDFAARVTVQDEEAPA